MEETKEKKTKEVKVSSFFRGIKKSSIFKCSIVLNIILLLWISFGTIFVIYPYLAKKFLNYGQQVTMDIYKKLYKKNISKLDFEIIDDNDIKARVQFDCRVHEKYHIRVLTGWELDQERYKQELNSLISNKQVFREIKRFLAMSPEWPVVGKFSSRFGNRKDPIEKGIGGDPLIGFHRGLDILVPKGTSVTPFLNGKVIKIVNATDQGLGKFVCIDHGDGLVSIYGHLSKIDVKEGQFVSKAHKIGLSGSTGTRSTGDHLHFQININDKPIDPELFFQGKILYL